MKQLLIIATLLVLSLGNVSALSSEKTVYQKGTASWYSISTNGGTRTASGKRLNNDASTVAHKTLPMGTIVKVTNLKNNKSEICVVQDRGPYTRGRIIDVTVGVARRLGFHQAGTTTVKIEVIK